MQKVNGLAFLHFINDIITVWKSINFSELQTYKFSYDVAVIIKKCKSFLLKVIIKKYLIVVLIRI